MDNQYTNPINALAGLEKQGFSNTFHLKGKQLFCKETGESFESENVTIIAFHRFEGNSDPDDMSIIYALETSTGTKGTIMDAFGTYANTELGEFLKRVQFAEGH